MFFCICPIFLEKGGPSQLMETNIEKRYGSGDHSNQRPIIHITKQTQEHISL